MLQVIRHIPLCGTAMPLPALARKGLKAAATHSTGVRNTKSEEKERRNGGRKAAGTHPVGGSGGRMALNGPIENP